MNELMILNEDNREVKSYAIYYTINDRFYIIYTEKEKDENGYIVLHIAKVLKEVNNTEEGIVPTGRYIGLEISDQNEWDTAKANIGEIVANKQSGSPASVSYLPVSEINGISIKSSKTFKLREDIVDSIIEEESGNELELEPVVQPAVEDDSVVPETTVEETPVVPEAFEVAAPAIEETPVDFPVADIPVAPAVEMPVEQPEVEIPSFPVEENNSFDDISAPALAPNPFDMQPEVEIPTTTIEEEKPVNPYEVMQQQRAEEMVSALANDNMQDIVAAPFIPVSELESKVEEAPVVEEAPLAPELTIDEEVPAVEEAPIAQPAVEETPVALEPVQVEETPELTEEPKEVISSESFVDSIVADVSDILDKKEEPTAEEKEDYERLYNDALEKTIELEKELAELHSKLNNIKNIVE